MFCCQSARAGAIKPIAFKRAEKFIKSHRIKERYEINVARQAKKPASCKLQVPQEPRLVFAVRICGLVRRVDGIKIMIQINLGCGLFQSPATSSRTLW